MCLYHTRLLLNFNAARGRALNRAASPEKWNGMMVVTHSVLVKYRRYRKYRRSLWLYCQYFRRS